MDITEKIERIAVDSAMETQKQLRKGEPAPEEMPDSFVPPEKEYLAEELGRNPEQRYWQLYRTIWEDEMIHYNDKKINIS